MFLDLKASKRTNLSNVFCVTSDIDLKGAQRSADIIILMRLYYLQPQPLSSFFKVLLTCVHNEVSLYSSRTTSNLLTCAMSRHFSKHGICGSKCIKMHRFELAPHPAECLGHRHLVCVLNRSVHWFSKRSVCSDLFWGKGILKALLVDVRFSDHTSLFLLKCFMIGHEVIL